MAKQEQTENVAPDEFEILDHRRAWTGDFLSVDRITVQYELFGKDEGLSEPRSFEICDRGDSAAALVLDPTTNEIILVNQFRLPTARPFQHLVSPRNNFKADTGRHTGGWLLETPAGTIRKKKITRVLPQDPAGTASQAAEEEVDEQPEECIRRELREEIGYAVNNLTRITTYYSSPGASSERVHLFFAEVRTDEKVDAGGGDATENIQVERVNIDDFFVRLLRHEFLDPKIIIAGHWLRDQLMRRRIEPKGNSRSFGYLHIPSGRRIEIITGDIVDVKGVEVWVNPENSHMLMDRYFGRSVSAAIRWHGASKRKTKQGKDVVAKDLIADELRKNLDNRTFVDLMDVVETGAGELTGNGVKRIMHVAIAEGFYEQGLKTDPETLKGCMHNVFAHIETHNRLKMIGGWTSVLFPMLGTGQGGLPVRTVAPTLVSAVIEYLARKPGTRLQRICFNAFSTDDLVELKRTMTEYCAAGVLKDLDPKPIQKTD